MQDTPSSSSAAPASPFRSAGVHVLLLLLLGAFVFFPALGQDRDIESHGGRHGEIAREMAQSGQYAVPYLLGEPYTMKPPLSHWAGALVFKVTGTVNWATARVPSALAALASALAVYALGRIWFGARAGFWSAALFMTFPLIVAWGRQVRMDGLMSCFILYAILFTVLAARTPRRGAAWALWCAGSVALGAAVLSKGLSPLFFFAVAALVIWRMERGRWYPPIALALCGLVLTAAVAGAWALAAEHAYPGYIHRMLTYQVDEGLVLHPARVDYYIEELLLRSLPWAFFVPGAVYAAVLRFKEGRRDGALVPALIVTVCMGIMSWVPNKRSHYLLPILPMLALFVGGYLAQAAARVAAQNPADQAGSGPGRWGRRLFAWPLWLCVGILTVGGAGAAIAWTFLGFGGQTAVWMYGGAVTGAGIYGCLQLRRGRHVGAIGSVLAGAIILSGCCFPLLSGYYWPPNAEVVAAQEARLLIPSGVAVGGYQPVQEAFYFVLNRPVQFVRDPEALTMFLRGDGDRYVLASSAALDEVRRAGAGPWAVVGRWDLGKQGGMALLRAPAAGEPGTGAAAKPPEKGR